MLDHCLLAKNVNCRSRRDCNDGMLCVMSGYSPDPRGNAKLTSSCMGSSGRQTFEADDTTPTAIPAPPPPVNSQELLSSVKDYAMRLQRGGQK